MFNFMKKPKVFVSPMAGKTVTIQEIPDEVFSQKIVGDGVAILPTDDEIFSPVDGEIIQIAESGHAFCIKSNDNVEILIHIGVDTVNMHGEGFEALAKVGQKVKKGELIARADIELIKQKGYHTHTAVLVTNMNIIKDLHPQICDTIAGETVILKYNLK